MQNAVLFTNSFLEYLICFGVSVIVVIIACVIGVSLRKSKNAKLEAEAIEAAQTDSNETAEKAE